MMRFITTMTTSLWVMSFLHVWALATDAVMALNRYHILHSPDILRAPLGRGSSVSIGRESFVMKQIETLLLNWALDWLVAKTTCRRTPLALRRPTEWLPWIVSPTAALSGREPWEAQREPEDLSGTLKLIQNQRAIASVVNILNILKKFCSLFDLAKCSSDPVAGLASRAGWLHGGWSHGTATQQGWGPPQWNGKTFFKRLYIFLLKIAKHMSWHEVYEGVNQIVRFCMRQFCCWKWFGFRDL